MEAQLFLDFALNLDEIRELEGDFLLVEHEENPADDLGEALTVRRGSPELTPIYVRRLQESFTLSDTLSRLWSLDQVTWDRVSIANYFETGWNNIERGHRTPFREVQKIFPGSKLKILCHGSRTKIFRCSTARPEQSVPHGFKLSNLEDFSKVFRFHVESALRKSEIKGSDLLLSGGIDSGTLAVVGARLGVINDAHTSELDNTADESEHDMAAVVASHANLNLRKHLINPPTDIVHSLTQLLSVTGSPVSDIEGLTHFELLGEVRRFSQSRYLLTGFGADLTFGGTPWEYPAMAATALRQGKLGSFYKICAAFLSSAGFTGEKKFGDGVVTLIKLMVWSVLPIFVRSNLNRRLINRKARGCLRFNLPAPDSSRYTGYEGAVIHAGMESALRQLTAMAKHFGLSLAHPFESREFLRLSQQCDPAIFAYGTGKYAIRKAVDDLLPRQILDEKKKIGSPGYVRSISQLWDSQILDYLDIIRDGRQSVLVDIDKLRHSITSHGLDEGNFRLLNLVMFEQMVGNCVDKNTSEHSQ